MVQYEFSAESSALDSATMHFRFGQTPGDIYLDDISVVDMGSGENVMPVCDFEGGDADFTGNWGVWPLAEKNTVGTIKVEKGTGKDGTAGLHVSIKAPPDGNWPDFHFYRNANLTIKQGHRYKVSFWANASPGRNLITSFYRPGATYVYLGGPPGHFESQVKLAASAGVNFVSTSVPMPWPAPGEKEDWSGVDSICDATINANPQALLIPRIPVYPPEWWNQKNPDELMVWESGTHMSLASPASKVFQNEASKRLSLLIKHLEEKYGEHMAGYHPVGQNTGEWFYMDSWERALNGYSPCDTIAFREWLRKRYVTREALRTAWSDNTVDFDTCNVPTAAARHAAPDGMFRNPVTERPIIDFVAFQQDSMADSVCGFARVVRQESQGRKLVLFFYGYIFEFSPVSTGAGSAGHYALRKVLDCPDIDVLCSPISYFDRGKGQNAPCMTAAESVTLAKKMWLNEDDTRTHLVKESLFPGWEHILNSAEETNALLDRNVAQEAMRNFATWWMDLGATGWFDDPKLWAEMKRLGNLDFPLLKKPVPFRPEVAAVIDEGSMLRLADGGDLVGRNCVYEARAALGRMGAPYGQYLLDDVAKGRVHAKLYVFLNPWLMDAKTRAAVLKAVKGSVCIWNYAPGYFDGYTKSPEAMRQLTGFTLTPTTQSQAMASATKGYQMIGESFGVSKRIAPLFTASDAKLSETLAVYPDGSSAVVMRKNAGATSIFIGAPGFTSDLLRFAARKAGVHLYTENDCNVYANGPYLALHGSSDGTLRVNTGSAATVTDVLTGKSAAKGPVFSLPLKRSETRIFKIK